MTRYGSWCLTTTIVFCGLAPAALDAAERIAAFTPGARILFQGDSITDGNRGRTADPNHILGHGYAFIIAARHGAAFPELRLDFLNRGVSGNTVLDLEKRWQEDTLDLKPGVLSILIGVNDNGKGVSLEQYEQVYDKLLTEATAANPKLKLVLGEPFVKPSGRVNEGIRRRQEIVARLAQKHGAALVRYQRVFDEAAKRAPADYWIWDGVHPTYRGHQLMADQWERTVRAFWPGALGAACDARHSAPQRHAWITGLKPEMAARYRDLHAHPWPSVNRRLKECHVQNFSIHQREIEGKLYLFAYLEYTGQDFEADMKRMAADPETQRWWKETDPCQLPLPDAAGKGKIWADMTEVYYLP